LEFRRVLFRSPTTIVKTIIMIIPSPYDIHGFSNLFVAILIALLLIIFSHLPKIIGISIYIISSPDPNHWIVCYHIIPEMILMILSITRSKCDHEFIILQWI